MIKSPPCQCLLLRTVLKAMKLALGRVERVCRSGPDRRPFSETVVKFIRA